MPRSLEAAAAASGRSLTREVEHRLADLFDAESAMIWMFGSTETFRLCSAIAGAINLVQMVTEKSFHEDRSALEATRSAVKGVMDLLKTHPVEDKENLPLAALAANHTGSLAAAVAVMIARGKHENEGIQERLSEMVRAWKIASEPENFARRSAVRNNVALQHARASYLSL